MDKDARDFLNSQLEFFQKSAELQFTHFMGVFYFWTLVVSAPVTAGLLTSSDKNADSRLGILLLLTAVLGLFLSAKMFDIRCSQLKYIAEINQIRDILVKASKMKTIKKMIR